jgi:WD40 repeat protein
VLTYSGHTAGVQIAIFNEDGTRVFSGSDDNSVHQWDVATGERINSFEEHQRSVRGIALHPDGIRIVSSDTEGRIYCWNRENPGDHDEMVDIEFQIYDVAISPDGRWLAYSTGMTPVITVLDLATGDEVATLTGHDDETLDLAFSPNGSFLLSAGSDRTLILWDTRTWEQLERYHGHHLDITSVAWNSVSPNQFISAGYDGTVRSWDVRDSDATLTLPVRYQQVISMCFSADDKTLYVADCSNGVLQFDVESGALEDVIFPESQMVGGVSFDSTNNILRAFSSDLALFELADSETTVTQLLLRRPQESAGLTAFSADGELAATLMTPDLGKVWSRTDMTIRFDIEGHESGPLSVAFDPSGKQLAAGGRDGWVSIWDTRSGRCLQRFEAARGTVDSVSYSPEGRFFASGGSNGVMAVRYADDYENVAFEIPAHTGSIKQIAFNPSCTRIATVGHGGHFKIWNVANGQLLLDQKAHDGVATAVCWSNDGMIIATGGDDTKVRLWEANPPGLVALGARKENQELQQMVRELFQDKTFAKDVIAALDRDQSLTPDKRNAAITLAEMFGDSARSLENDAWLVVRAYGASEEEYEEALHKVQEADRLLGGENASVLNTLGTAHYRIGKYQLAYDALSKSNETRGGTMVQDLAVLTMVCCKLQKYDEARTHYSNLVDVVNRGRDAADDSMQSLFNEATKMMEESDLLPETPGSGR